MTTAPVGSIIVLVLAKSRVAHPGLKSRVWKVFKTGRHGPQHYTTPRQIQILFFDLPARGHCGTRASWLLV